MTKHKKHTKARLAFTGFSMGIADLVPGVSGGTIAFLYGIYDELLFSIKTVTGKVPKHILQGQFKEAITTIPFGFLIPVFTGIVLAIFGLVNVFTYLLETHPIYLWSAFFGLVLGSAFVVRKRISTWNASRLIAMIIAFIATFALMSITTTGEGNSSAIATLFTGSIASIAMILPGISGSLIMVMLGQYEIVIGYVSDRNLPQITIFVAGAVIGLGLFSRVLTWLLRNHHSLTIAVLVGIMLGSLRRVWPWQTEAGDKEYAAYLPVLEPSTYVAVILIIAGFILVWYLEKIGIAREHDDISSKEFSKEISSQHN